MDWCLYKAVHVVPFSHVGPTVSTSNLHQSFTNADSLEQEGINKGEDVKQDLEDDGRQEAGAKCACEGGDESWLVCV